jgi:hypothetical protein
MISHWRSTFSMKPHQQRVVSPFNADAREFLLITSINWKHQVDLSGMHGTSDKFSTKGSTTK